jgi:flagellar protein FliS
MNPYATTVKQAYTETSVMTASPVQLIVMLYDGAVRFLRQSAAAMRAAQIEQARDRMRRAEDIIDELNWALDMSHGEIPQNLRMIYTFSKRQLVRATLDKDADRIEAVARRLGELRESWATVAERADAAA